jgi:hypothetical protein
VTATITVTPVNDAPTATNLSEAQTYTEDTALNLTDIVVTDPDNAPVTATLTLSVPAAGSLSTASRSCSLAMRTKLGALATMWKVL